MAEEVVCWEALEKAAELTRAQRLYETLLEPAERIPWAWIEGAVDRRLSWRPGRWSPHLLLAAPRRQRGGPAPVVGFAYGTHVPGYGGYACYLAVEPRQRGHGIGSRLLSLLVRLCQVDAACEGVPLPFVIWESHAPEDSATEEEHRRWQSRLRLFQRLGAWWLSGITLLAPSFAQRGGTPVPLQLFLLCVDRSPDTFDVPALRQVAAGLLEEVYGREAGDFLFDQTLPSDCRPVLRPVSALLEAAPHAGPREESPGTSVT